MAKALPLPDGSTVAIREGETPAQTWARAQQMYPEAFGNEPEKPTGPGPKSGFMPALKAGFSSLKGDVAALAGRSGIMDIPAAEKYRAEQEEYQAKTFKPTETWGEAPLTKFTELAGGAIPYMAAPIAAGVGAVTLPVSAPVGAAIGTGLAGLASAAQFTGSGLSRQVKEGTPLAETNLGGAVAAAIPSAALDMVSLKMMPGIRQIFAAAGKEVPEAVAKKIAEQGLKDTLKDYGTSAVKTMSVEGLTETGQQVLERMQAGLNLTDPKARDEYLESFIGGAVLGGAIAPVGRRFERGSEAAAQDKEALVAKRAAAAEQQKVANEAAAKEETFKQSPDYALQVADKYAAAEKAKADLLAQKRKITQGSPTETADKAFNKTLYEQVQAQAAELKNLGAEYARLEPTIKQAKEQKRVEGMSPEEYSLEQMAQGEATPARGRAARMAALNQPIPEDTVDAPEAAYAAERLALAKEQNGLTADTSDYVNYLMTNPRMAQTIVDNQTALPGLARKEQNVVRGALKLQLQAAENQRTAAAQAGTAAGQARIGSVEQEEQAATQAQQEADAAEATRMASERSEAERRVKIAPEIEGIQRLGKTPEGTWSSSRADQIFRDMYRKNMDEQQVERLIASLPLSNVSTPGKIYAGMGFETSARRDLLTRMAVAKAHAGVEDVTQLRQELADLDSKAANKTAIGERLPGEGMLPEAEKYTVAAEKLADKQSQTLREYIRFLQDQKEGKVRGTIRAGRAERAAAASEDFKNAYAKQYVEELNARLKAFGLPESTEVENKIATGRVMRNLNELGERWGNAANTPRLVNEKRSEKTGDTTKSYATYDEDGLLTTVNIVRKPDGTMFRIYLEVTNAEGKTQRAEMSTGYGKGTDDAYIVKAIAEPSDLTLVPPGQKAFAAPVQAVEVLQEQVRSGMFKTLNDAADRYNLAQSKAKTGLTKTSEGGARIATPDELKLRAESTVPKDDMRIATETAKQLRDTLDQRTYATPEQPANKGKEGSNRADMALTFGAKETGLRADIASRLASLDANTKDFVRLADDVLPEITDPALVTSIKEELQAIAEGRKLDPSVQRDLTDFVTGKAKAGASTTRPGATQEELRRTSAQPQTSLPGFEPELPVTQRATPKNFQKMLDSKDVQGMRDAIEKLRTDNEAVIEQAKQNTPAALRAARVAKARIDYNFALAKAQKSGEILTAFKITSREELKGAYENVNELETQGAEIRKQLKQMDEIRASLANKFDMFKMLDVQSLFKQEKGLKAQLNIVDAAVRDAHALVAAIDKTQAKDTAELKDAIAENKQIEKEFEATKAEQTAAQKAQFEANNVRVAVEKETSELTKFREAAQRVREGLDLPGLRVTVDTTKMQSQINGLRSAMGSLSAQIVNAEKAAETAKTEVAKANAEAKKVALQERYDAAEAKLEQVYESAPRISTALKERDQLTFEKAFDEVQIAAYDKQLSKKRIREGEYGPALVNRRQGPVERKGSITVQTGEKRATAASEMAGSALERVAQERTALRELEDRVAFLRANGKDKIKGRLTEPFKALQEKVVKQAALVKQFEEAQQATVTAVRDINKEERAAKAKPGYGGDRFQAATPDVELGPKVEVDPEESAGAVMRIVAQTSKDPITRAIAERLQFLLGATKVNIVEDLRDDTGNPVYGSAKIDGSSISLDAKEGTNERTVMHEGIHAATERVLRMPDKDLTPDQRAAKRELQALYNAYKADAKAPNMNARTDLSEFLSESLTDPELKAYLESKKWTMRNMWTGLKNGILKLLGIKVPVNMMQATLAVADTLMTKVPRIAERVDGVEVESVLRPKAAKYSAANALTDLADAVIASPKSFKERVGNNFGLEFEMQTTDMRAGLREALKRGSAEMGDDKLFTQAMYNVIKSDQRMPLVQTTMTNGPLEMYTDAKGLKGWRSTNKNSAVNVFDAISAIPGGNAQAKINMATIYMIAQRAANKGAAKLDIGALGVTQAKLDAAMAAVEADPELKAALEAARAAYNAYNEGMINALASTGAIPKALAAKLLKDGDYVPFYRVNENGMADLVFSDEVTINIGDIRHQPYLAELKGGEAKILPLNESLPRNTLLLTDKMLTNLATKNVAYAFQAMGDGTMPIHKGRAPSGPDVIKFNQEPDVNDPKDNGQRWLQVKTAGTAMEGIPAELVVKSLEGAHLTLPAFLKIGGIAGDLLRAGVTRMPMYLARQLIRDPMAASFTGGLNYGPLRAVAKAGKEFIAMSRGKSETGAKLMEKGLIQSGIFTGDPSDLSKMALQIASGKDQGALDGFLAMLDRGAMRADAATRVQVYDNAIANGLSEVEADMMTMESMNFYKRGLSPTIQYAARLIPFFNAQIQGLNVLYKAATGKMPFEEQQQIKRKFYNNAMLLVATGVVYAMAMEDDEYYKNAKPRDKYSNFFMPIPGVAEPLKIPVPYESGWFFSLAVAAVDAMKAETDGKQQWQALRDMFLNAIPGYSSAGMPQVIKPVFEVWTNKNYFSGNAIESARMERLSPQERFSASTTEAAKALAKALPMLSPVKIEHLATGYFGQLPLVIAGAANGLFRREGAGEEPESRITETPFVGQAFQKKFGGADTDVVYREATDAIQAKATYNKIRKEGRAEDAKEFLDDHRVDIAAAGMAANYQTQMGRLRADADRTTSMPNLSAQEKRARLDKIEEARQNISQRYRAALNRIETAVDKTTPR